MQDPDFYIAFVMQGQQQSGLTMYTSVSPIKKLAKKVKLVENSADLCTLIPLTKA